MLSVSLLLLSLLTISTPNIISTAIHQPGLSFQVDDDNDLSQLIPPSTNEEESSSSTSQFGWPSSSYSHFSAQSFAFHPSNSPPPIFNPNGFPFSNLFHSVLRSFSVPGPAIDDLYPSSPHYHHGHQLADPIDCRQFTIGQVLNWTLHHTPKPEFDHDPRAPPLHRFAWLVNTSHTVQEILYDPHADLTLFAPDDEALTPPSKRKHHYHPFSPPHESNLIDSVSYGEHAHPFWDALEAVRSDHHCHHSHAQAGKGDDKNGWLRGKGELVKFYLQVIEFVLKYHISPGSKTIPEILDRSTLATKLPVFPWSEQPSFRVRVGSASPHLSKPGEIPLNFLTILDAFKSRPILTKNGVIYVVQKLPLLQPLSPLSEMFLFPQTFATLTSALQKVRLDEILLPRWANKTIPISELESPSSNSGFRFGSENPEDVDERVLGILSSITNGEDHAKLRKPSFTIFAPTNLAFLQLGQDANAFLFSPFGEHILRYILSYHVVPGFIWHTDYCQRTEHGKAYDCKLNYTTSEAPEFPPSSFPVTPGGFGFHPPPMAGKANITEFTLPTLLGNRKNESLPISLVEFRHPVRHSIVRHVLIKPNHESSIFEKPGMDVVPVFVADAVAWGGALHLVPRLIRPPVPKGHRGRKDVQRALELSILRST